MLVAFVGALALGAAMPAAAHCDGEDGPVATAALRTFETGNVHRVLPYAPAAAAAEAEIMHAFKQATTVRVLGSETRALADRHFMETVVLG